MPTWQEIAVENFQSARELMAVKRYRSSVSRFYYAAFSIVTEKLSEQGIAFGEQETPNHKALPKLIKLHLPLESRAKSDCVSITRRLYAARIAADYRLQTTNEAVAREARRDAALLFRYLEVEYD